MSQCAPSKTIKINKYINIEQNENVKSMSIILLLGQ
jgi:hypothetical protein